jgi:hypothetical protein
MTPVGNRRDMRHFVEDVCEAMQEMVLRFSVGTS